MRDESPQNLEEPASNGEPQTMSLSTYIADGCICRDLACAQCGYNLRTMACDARCPECNFAVAATLRCIDLWGADPRWLRRVSLGLMIAAFMPAIVYIFALMMDGGRLSASGVAVRHVVKSLVCFPIGGWLIGAWLFASPEPDRSRPNRTRRMVRIAACVLLLTLLIAVIDDRWSIVPGQITKAIEIAVLLSASTLVGYAYVLSKRFRHDDEKRFFDDLLPVAATGLFLAAVGIVIGILFSDAADPLGFAGICLLVPIGFLVIAGLLELAYNMRRMANAAIRAGRSDPPHGKT